MSDLIAKLRGMLGEADPPHALLQKGIFAAAGWVNSLSQPERDVVLGYVAAQLDVPGQAPHKEELVMMLQLVGGADSLEILERVIAQGSAVQGEYLWGTAKHARNKILGQSRPLT